MAERVLIACAMMEDEVGAALQRTGAECTVAWVDRGFHRDPDRLRHELQRRIDWAEVEGASQVMLAFGLCGNGAVGLRTQQAVLAMPRFDDCVNLMLVHGPRTCRALAEGGVMYLTRGWTHDSAASVAAQREDFVLRFGPRKAERLMQAMYGSYRAVSVIENGCYDTEQVMDAAQEAADALGVGVRRDQGGNSVLEKLLSGQWDDDILVCEPGRAVQQEDFEFGGCGSMAPSREERKR